MKTDVLIVGAGPVGLTLAAELARYGLSVRVIDKNQSATDKSKALVLWPRTLELMNRMGPGCAESFVDAGMKVPGARILSGKDEIASVDLTHIESPHNYVLMIPQSDTERLMEAHLGTFGVKVERQTELKEFQADSDGVVGKLARSDGSEESASAFWLIGCDGAHSTVRHQLGKAFVGSTMLTDWILADFHVTGLSGQPAVEIYWHADGALALFPLGGTRYRAIADVGESSGSIGETHAEPKLEDVQRVLDVRGPGGLQASDAVWLSSFSINERKVEDYRDGRVFLAGDAAHVHSPAGGQGMNTGMQDACNLAWKLALVARKICGPEPLLDSYSAERSAIAKGVLEATGKATTIAIMKGGVRQSIRNHIASLVLGLPAVKHTMADVLSELSVGYSESPLNNSAGHVSGGPGPGKRAPIRKDESPVGSGREPLFAVCSENTAELRAILLKYRNLCEPNARRPYAIGGTWLLRPDGYVAFVGKQGSEDGLDSYLNRLAGTGRVANA
jgi:2-polyprenyl-6-methoxyphenol hydroxylase-like FAD-dependent oxidoreductase